MVGRRDSSVEGVGEGCVRRMKSSICRDCENKVGKVIVWVLSGGGILLVGTTGEGGSVAPEREEARFLDEQVLRVSGGLREVEDALARFWGGVREDGEGSDMVGYFEATRMFEFNLNDGTGTGAKSAGLVNAAYDPLGSLPRP